MLPGLTWRFPQSFQNILIGYFIVPLTLNIALQMLTVFFRILRFKPLPLYNATSSNTSFKTISSYFPNLFLALAGSEKITTETQLMNKEL